MEYKSPSDSLKLQICDLKLLQSISSADCIIDALNQSLKTYQEGKTSMKRLVVHNLECFINLSTECINNIETECTLRSLSSLLDFYENEGRKIPIEEKLHIMSYLALRKFTTMEKY